MVNQIKTKSKNARITIRELEKRAQLGENTIYRWDNAPPSIDKVARVARVLGCTVDELITDADEAEGTLVPA